MPRFPFPQMKALPLSLATGLALFLTSPPPPSQALTLTMLEVGNDVVVSGSGTLNLTALQGPIPDFNGVAFVDPEFSSFLLGEATDFDVYSGTIAFPANFGSGTYFETRDGGSGDALGPVQIFGFGREIWVPAGYQSGEPINSSAIFPGQSLASLGVTPGIYTWTWGSGADSDDLTLLVEESIPPVPGPLPLLGAAAAFGWSRRLRKRCLQARR
jgi:hypothetical protein